MNAMAFDTYTAAKRLRDAGFNEHQAEAAVTMVRDAVVADREARVTKADLDAAISGLESRLMARMGTFEARMGAIEARMDTFEARMDTFATKAELAALETRLTHRLYAVVLAAVRGQRPHRGRTQGVLTSLARRAACRLGIRRVASPRSAGSILSRTSSPISANPAAASLRNRVSASCRVTAMVANSTISLFRLTPRYRASSFNRAWMSSGKRRVNVVIRHSPVISSPGVRRRPLPTVRKVPILVTPASSLAQPTAPPSP